MNIEPGQTWQMYSRAENRWVRVIVTKIDDGRVTLRYEGLVVLDILHPHYAPSCIPRRQHNDLSFGR